METRQKKLLRELAAAAEVSATGTDAERQEVADAIRKSLHRLTLRQGVFRLLDGLGLQDMKKPWDDLYKERSTLVHGLAPKPDASYSDLARRTVSLCGQILLKAVAAEIPQADRHVARMYSRRVRRCDDLTGLLCPSDAPRVVGLEWSASTAPALASQRNGLGTSDRYVLDRDDHHFLGREP